MRSATFSRSEGLTLSWEGDIRTFKVKAASSTGMPVSFGASFLALEFFVEDDDFLLAFAARRVEVEKVRLEVDGQLLANHRAALDVLARLVIFV